MLGSQIVNGLIRIGRKERKLGDQRRQLEACNRRLTRAVKVIVERQILAEFEKFMDKREVTAVSILENTNPLAVVFHYRDESWLHLYYNCKDNVFRIYRFITPTEMLFESSNLDNEWNDTSSIRAMKSIMRKTKERKSELVKLVRQNCDENDLLVSLLVLPDNKSVFANDLRRALKLRGYDLAEFA